jgi:HSP20 family molecular chaperone IbpA
MAVAGFSKDDIEIKRDGNLLSVRGQAKEIGSKVIAPTILVTGVAER